jgi:parallel beta-helix repeat protein
MSEGRRVKERELRCDLAFTLLVASVMISSCAVAAETEVIKQCQLPNGGRINGVVELDSSCTYRGSVVITRNNTSLNCRGATLDGGGERKFGILITGKGQEIKNVSVKNCSVVNYAGVGVMVASGIKFDRDGDRDYYYKNAPKNISLSNLKVEGNARGGVTFNAYVTGSTLRNSIVSNTNAAGVYLSQSSRGNSVLNNIIQGNGWRSKPGGWREGLAVDSSAKNQIIGNKFSGNAAGGIFIYKNCGEHFSNGRSVLRWQSSNENLIKNNTFSDEKIGVWVASRQSRDLSRSDCGDPSVDIKGRFYRDFADKNLIEGNRFCGVKVGVRVEGDSNRVVSNVFDKATKIWISEPYKTKPKPDGALTSGNLDISNSFQECNI